MRQDRFGNAFAPGLPYARGHILRYSEDDFRKCQEAWRHIAARARGHSPDAIFDFSGLEHGPPLHANELPIVNDFVASALYFDPFKQAALAMLLLRDYGVITVHFVGLLPGTAALMIKFIPPETLQRFDGAQAYAQAIHACLHTLAGMFTEPEQICRLLLGDT